MFQPIKKLGQNFLKDQNQVKKMVNALEVKDGDTIIEIGAGLGAVTLGLVQTYGHWNIKIKALEIDPRFVDKLNTMFPEYKNVEIIETSVLDWLPKYTAENPTKIIGSLPYYITTPIIHKILKMHKQAEVCVLLVQKEVAQKIAAKAPDATPISVFVQSFYDVEYVATIDKSEFEPMPEVDGGVIKLTKRLQTEKTKIENIEKYERFLHKAFSNPRKMLNKIFYADELNRTELSGNQRAQNYNWEDWVRAFKILN